VINRNNLRLKQLLFLFQCPSHLLHGKHKHSMRAKYKKWWAYLPLHFKVSQVSFVMVRKTLDHTNSRTRLDSRSGHSLDALRRLRCAVMNRSPTEGFLTGLTAIANKTGLVSSECAVYRRCKRLRLWMCARSVAGMMLTGAAEIGYSEEQPSQCHFVRHKSQQRTNMNLYHSECTPFREILSYRMRRRVVW